MFALPKPQRKSNGHTKNKKDKDKLQYLVKPRQGLTPDIELVESFEEKECEKQPEKNTSCQENVEKLETQTSSIGGNVEIQSPQQTENGNKTPEHTKGNKSEIKKKSGKKKQASYLGRLNNKLEECVTKVKNSKQLNFSLMKRRGSIKVGLIEQGGQKIDAETKAEDQGSKNQIIDQNESRLQQLQTMFPTLQRETILKILADHNGEVENALEDLVKQPPDAVDLIQRPMTAELVVEDSVSSNDGSTISTADLKKLIEWGKTDDDDAAYQVAVALADLSMDESARQKVMRVNGLEGLLVLARSQNTEVLKYTLCACANLALDIDNQQQILDAGFLSILATTLITGNVDIKEQSARAVANLCFHNEKAEEAVFQHGLLPILMRLLKEEQTQLKCEALAALGNLSRNPSIQGEIMKSGDCDWSSITGFLRSSHQDLQNQAARLFANISIHPDNKNKIVQDGALPSLLYCFQMGGKSARRLATMAFANLSSLEENRLPIIEAGAAVPLVSMLKKEPEDQLQAARALYNILCSADVNFKLQLVQKGLIGHLMTMNDTHNAVNIQILASKMLSLLNTSVPGISYSL